QRVTSLAPSPVHPVWLLRLGRHVVFASPFEMTTMAARAAELAIVQAFREHRRLDVTAGPIGLAGDYAGYVTTRPEDHAQHYDGAPTFYGDRQLDVLSRVWTRRATLPHG